jgi:uncharacterized membrane protein
MQPMAMIPALALAAAGGYAIYRTMNQPRGRRYAGDAPSVSLRGQRPAGQLASAVVTIDRPRPELYDYWRDFTNLPSFMENVRSVEILDENRSRWTIAAPGGQEVVLVSRITQDIPGESITWRSTPESEIRNSGRILFKDEARGRGTVVSARIAYKPPFGTAGKYVARLFGREPELQANRELRRFKQLMETGEIATAKAHANQHES